MNRRSFLALLGTAAVLRKLPLPKTSVVRETYQWDAGICIQDWRYAIHADRITATEILAQQEAWAAHHSAAITEALNRAFEPLIERARWILAGNPRPYSALRETWMHATENG